MKVERKPKVMLLTRRLRLRKVHAKYRWRNRRVRLQKTTNNLMVRALQNFTIHFALNILHFFSVWSSEGEKDRREFYSDEFVPLLRGYSAKFRDGDLISLAEHFLVEVDPQFPPYVVNFTLSTRRSMERRFRIAKARDWNPVTTLIGLLALEGLIQILELAKTETKILKASVLNCVNGNQIWESNAMGIFPSEIAARLAIETYCEVQSRDWIDQLVHKLSIYIPGMIIIY